MEQFLVILDEDLPKRALEPLQTAGYDVRNVVQLGWDGLKDPNLWPLIQRQKAFFITADKGFGDIRLFPPGSHFGILLLRPDREGVMQFVRLLDRVLKTHSLRDFAGAVVVADHRRVRIRRPPAVP